MDQIEEIKQKVDVVGLITEYVAVKKTGRNFKACCPFHHEKTPSFVISPERQIWHCFGCNEGGDVFEFIQKIENIEFPEALRILAERAGVKLQKTFSDQKNQTNKERLYQLNHLASEFYHYLLLNHPAGKEPLGYILNRGINKKSLEIFKIGYSPQAWQGVSKFLLKKGYSLEEMESAGLVIINRQTKSFYDRFRARLMFTLKDHRGNIVGFAGRKLPRQNEDEKEAKYINSPETPIYIKGNTLFGLDVTKEAIRRENKAVIVEGEIDAISSFQAGVSQVVAIKGSALTEGQLMLLKRFCDTLYLSLDADLAGDMAARRGIELAEGLGFSIKVVRLKAGKDPNECIQKDPLLWRESVNQSVGIYDFYLDSALSKFDIKTAEGKKKATAELLPIFSRIVNLVVRDHYFKLLSQKLSVETDVLMQEAKRIVREEKGLLNPTNIIVKPKTETDRRQILEEKFLAMILQADNPGQYKNTIEKYKGFLKYDANKNIVNLLLSDFTNRVWDVKKFCEKISSELTFLVNKLFLHELNLENEDERLKELENVGGEIHLLSLKEKLRHLKDKIKEIKDEKDLKKINLEFSETAVRIKELEGL